jgi:HK97 family phage major capsid protein
MSTRSTKAVSLNERVERVRQTIYQAMTSSTYEDLYVEHVYENYAIVRDYPDGLYWRIAYTESNDGVTIQPRAEWQRVEQEWAAKSTVLAQNNHALKALGDGKIGGYLVLFSSADQPDLTGVDYFDAATDFDMEDGQKTAVYYQHGLDATLKRRKLGNGTLKKDDVGVWLEAQLELRDQYEQAIYGLVEAGKCGLSSGTAAHLVEREPVGSALHIKRWPLGLDASITPTPCEPRTRVLSLKSFDSISLQANGQQAAGDAATASATANGDINHPMQEFSSMNEEQIKQFVNDAIKAALADATKTAESPAAVDTNAVIRQAIDEAMKALMDGAPARKTAGVEVPNIHIKQEETAETKALKAFQQYVRTGDPAAKATLNTGTDVTGGYLVPDKYSNELITGLKDASILRAAGARILPITGTDAYHVPTMLASGRAVRTNQNAAFNQNEPTFGDIVFNPYKMTRLSKATDEQLADSRIDVVSTVLLPDARQAFAAGENEDFTTGTGTNQPQGIVTGATAMQLPAGNVATFTADHVIDLYHTLPYLCRMNAIFMANDAAIKILRKLKTGDNQYLWQPGLVAGQPDRLLGRPLITNNAMAVPAANAKTLLFGDLSYFWIADFAGLEFKRLEELYAETGHIGFRWYLRNDSRVMLPEAIRVLQQSAT